MLPHLLVVGARNSYDQGPAGFCIRPSGERGGGGGSSIGEIGPPPPPHVTLTPPGLADSNLDKLKELEEEERCPIDSREALPYGQHIVGYSTRRCTATFEYCTDSAPKVPTRTDGETSALRILLRPSTERDCRARGRPLLCDLGETAYMHRRLWSFTK